MTMDAMNSLLGGNALLALAAAILWGGGDFSGGMGVKRAGGSLGAALRVVLLSHATSFIVLVAIARLRGDAAPHGALLAWGIAAGVCRRARADGLLHRAVARRDGSIGRGQRTAGGSDSGGPDALAGRARRAVGPLIGFAMAAIAIWLIATGPAAGSADNSATAASRQTMALAILAGVGFGFYFIALKMASPAGVIWPMASAQNRQPLRLLAPASWSTSAVRQECRSARQPQPHRGGLGAGNRAAGHIRQSALCGGDARGTAGCGGGACLALPRVHHPAGGACSGRVAHASPGAGNGRRRARRRPHRAVEHFHSRCRVGRKKPAWFSLKENHTARAFRQHRYCENALTRMQLAHSAVLFCWDGGLQSRQKNGRAGRIHGHPKSIPVLLAVCCCPTG